MASFNDNGIRTFTAGEALERYRRVKLSTGTVVYADSDEACIGVTEREVANGEQVAVRLINHAGTFLIAANEAIDLNDVLYGANDGKITDTNPGGTGTARFKALTTGSGDGALVECLPTTLA